MGYFKDVTPESVGISSKGIMKFLDRMEQNQIELHSFMVIRHGQCAAKGWWKPYDEKFRHPLYSFSKSLTATAIGFAQQEGILSVDEKIVDIFPELLPEHPSEYLKKITLHHLLIMGCGHETEISDNSENWISTFLHHPVLHEPGTFYKYNTAGTNMLAAVLRRKTGQNVTEFLKPRLLEPLGITSLTCALLGDGTELGGGGMKMVTEDMAKFTYFLSRQGEWEGKQLLRKEWFERACHKQIETEGDSEGHVKDWAQGYGYQCWMGRYPGSFRADGAYGQFGVVFPDLDLIVILTSSTEQTQEELSALQEDLIPYVQKEAGELAPSPLAETVKEYTAQLALPPRRGTRNPFMEEKVSKHVYVSVPVLNDRLPDSAEVLIGGSGLFQLETSPIQEMRFAFGSDKMYWKVLEDGKEIGLEEASSGLQSVVPLYVYVYYLTHWIYDHQEDISFEKKDRIEGALSREYIKMFSKQMNVVMDEEFLNQAVKEAKLSPGFKKILGTAKTLKKAGNDSLDNLLETVLELEENISHPHYSNIIVEEPELNLFPETQKDLIYDLLEMINSGRDHLLMTTHSPYLLYALNNCMLGALLQENIPEEEEGLQKMKDSFVKPEDVSVWEIKNGKFFPYKENPNYTIQDERGLIRNNYFDRIMKNIMTDFAALMDYCDED